MAQQKFQLHQKKYQQFQKYKKDQGKTLADFFDDFINLKEEIIIIMEIKMGIWIKMA